MKILLNREPAYNTPWGGGNDLLVAFCSWARALGHDVVHQWCSGVDVIFLFNHRDTRIQWFLTQGVPTLLRVNECNARGRDDVTDAELQKISRHCTSTVFVSNWMQRYHAKAGWHCADQHVIINGVDRELYKPREKFGEQTNIVTHHWSSNENKGQTFYEELDKWCRSNEDFTFTYIGRTNRPLSRVIGPLHGEELARELGRYDVYVSASRFDPGPNHTLQSLACGLPTYVHRDGGGAVEFAGADHAFSSFDELISIIERGKDHYRYNDNAIKLISWEECIAQYIKLIESII